MNFPKTEIVTGGNEEVFWRVEYVAGWNMSLVGG